MTKIDIESTCTVCGTTSKGTLTLEMPAREWVGLTDEQIRKTFSDCDEGQEAQEYILAFARAIEAKLREKNA